MEAKDTRGPAIQVKELYKVYRMGDTKVYALNGVDFTISRGEFCAITGPSGSGKSTLLNMLAGLEHPSKGEIVIAGKHIEKLNEKQLVTFRRERVGFIFQSYNLISTMDAVENVALPLSFRGIWCGNRQGPGGESADYLCRRAHGKPGFQNYNGSLKTHAENCEGAEPDTGDGDS